MPELRTIYMKTIYRQRNHAAVVVHASRLGEMLSVFHAGRGVDGAVPPAEESTRA
jgi:hypothetical protein